jgi:hypothetical protein
MNSSTEKKFFLITKLNKSFLNFVIGLLFLISLDNLLKMSPPLWAKLCSNNLIL